MPQLDTNGLQLSDLDPHAVEDVVENAGAGSFDGGDAKWILHSFAFFSQSNSSGCLQGSVKEYRTGVFDVAAVDEVYTFKDESAIGIRISTTRSIPFHIRTHPPAPMARATAFHPADSPSRILLLVYQKARPEITREAIAVARRPRSQPARACRRTRVRARRWPCPWTRDRSRTRCC